MKLRQQSEQLFDKAIIHHYTEEIDRLMDQGLKVDDYLDKLLHFISLEEPLNRDQLNFYKYVESWKGVYQ